MLYQMVLNNKSSRTQTEANSPPRRTTLHLFLLTKIDVMFYQITIKVIVFTASRLPQVDSDGTLSVLPVVPHEVLESAGTTGP